MSSIAFLLLSFLHCTFAAYTSSEKLSNALDIEELVVTRLEEMVELLRRHTEELNAYVEEYRSLKKSNIDMVSLVSHPVSGYRIMKRFARGWKQVEESVKSFNKVIIDKSDDLISARRSIGFPVESDFQTASQCVVIAQDTYDLNITMMGEGKINTKSGDRKVVLEVPMNLSAWDCSHLAQAAQGMNWYGRAVSWYKEALNKVHKGDNTIDARHLRRAIINTTVVHDKILHLRGPRGNQWKCYNKPFDPQLAKRKKFVQDKWMPKLFQNVSTHEEQIHFEKLCRGEKLRTPKLDEGLLCKYFTGAHPYFLVGPLKLEELSAIPFIGIFHDFISNEQLHNLMNIVKRSVGPSPYHRQEERITELHKTAHVLGLGRNNVTDPLSKKIEMALSLEVAERGASEKYQMTNYGLGGQHSPHKDFLGDLSNAKLMDGDRIASLMIYLSDVSSGGATVFTRTGVTVWPKRRSALFWWNLYKNGEGDPQTRHGGCPVLHGSKWIAIKWILANAQFSKAKCGLKYTDKFTSEFWNTQSRV